MKILKFNEFESLEIENINPLNEELSENENRQRIKNEALNKIRKIYATNSNFKYSNYEEDGSYSEQRDDYVRSVLNEMEKELNKIKV